MLLVIIYIILNLIILLFTFNFGIWIHVGVIHCIAASTDGQIMCSTAEDKSLKVFDVVNFGKK